MMSHKTSRKRECFKHKRNPMNKSLKTFIRLVIQILKQYSITQPEIEPNCMNRDRGAYSLPTAYDSLLVTCSTSRNHKPDKARRWRAKRRN